MPEETTAEVTPFQEQFEFFLAGITDDMFMEMTREDTEELLEEILLAALPHFEFPLEKNLFDSIDLENKTFGVKLNLEEKMIKEGGLFPEYAEYLNRL